MKQPYTSPTLTRYGSLRELTAGGTGPNNENLTFMFAGMSYMFCVMAQTWQADISCLP